MANEPKAAKGGNEGNEGKTAKAAAAAGTGGTAEDHHVDLKHASKALGFLGSSEGFVEEQTGFPPYWKPDAQTAAAHEPQGFHGTVVGFEAAPELDADEEAADGQFDRVILRALSPLQCVKGSETKNTLETVMVQPGEFFSITDYKLLNLGRFMGCEVKALVKDKVKLSAKKTGWVWKLYTSPASHALRQERLEAALEHKLASGGAAPRQLPAPSNHAS